MLSKNANLPNPRAARTAPTWPWPTSLNSGFRVFFRTLVLYLDLFPMFGRRKLVGNDGVRLGAALETGSGEPPLPTCVSIHLHSQADKGVRVAVGVHGGKVGAAQHTHQQAALPGAVAQGQQDAPALLPCCLRLLLQGWAVVSRVQPRACPPSPASVSPDGTTQAGCKNNGGRQFNVMILFPKTVTGLVPWKGNSRPTVPSRACGGEGLAQTSYWSVQGIFVMEGKGAGVSGTNMLGAS